MLHRSTMLKIYWITPLYSSSIYFANTLLLIVVAAVDHGSVRGESRPLRQRMRAHPTFTVQKAQDVYQILLLTLMEEEKLS